MAALLRALNKEEYVGKNLTKKEASNFLLLILSILPHDYRSYPFEVTRNLFESNCKRIEKILNNGNPMTIDHIYSLYYSMKRRE
jgi:hypothetical protein